jgi:hypothetical protein
MSATFTSITTSTGGIAAAFDYSPYLERIATALETIASLSTGTGVRVAGPYDWLKPTEVYSWYNQNLSLLDPSTATISNIVSDLTTITNSLPKFI